MVEGTWGHLTHAAQQVLVHVGEFNQCDVRREAEGFFDEIEQGVGTEQQQTIYNKVVVFAVFYLRETIVADPVQREVGEGGSSSNENCRPEQLGTTGQFA